VTAPLTVIIPHLNDEDGLDRNLETLVREREDVPGLEIIVVDNGSPNPPAEVVAKHGAILMHEATPGPGPARSTGAHAATAPILAFIDSDCIAEPGWANCILAHFAQADAEPILGGDVFISLRESGRPDMIEAFESVYNYRQKFYVEKHHFSATANLATRAEVFAKVGDFAGINIAEDRDWGQRATAMGYAIRYRDELKVSTPARPDFAEVCRKIDRQTSHDYAILGTSIGAKAKWFAKALALVASPLGEVFRIAASDRLSGFRAKSLCLLCLARSRAYRGGLMLKLLFNWGQGLGTGGWNRSS